MNDKPKAGDLSIEQMSRLFPDYEVQAFAGHNGLAALYQARQRSLDRLVTIKLLPLHVKQDREFTDRFTREAQTMAKLHHPNLVELYSFGETAAGHRFIVMERIEGDTLHELESKGPLVPQQAIRVVEQVCGALACVHREGIVHRNIKPKNILVDTHHTARLMGFGIARQVVQRPGEALTMQGVVIGTLDYMSPEQRSGEPVDQRSDIYALGVVLYEALTGRTPHDGCAPASGLAGTSPMLDEILARALQRNPAARFQSVEEMKAALKAVPLGNAAPHKIERLKPTPAPPPAPAPTRAATSPAKRKGRPVVWIAVAAAAIVAAIGVALVWPSKSVRSLAPAPLATPTPAAIAQASPVQKATPQPSPSATLASVPSEPLTFGNSRYQFIRSQVSWMQAKTEAEFKGGHLATLTTRAEAEWVRTTFGPALPRKWARIWIGAYQADREAPWRWVTDEPFEFKHWCPGQPDGAKGSAAPPFAAALSNSLDLPGSNGWDDEPANSSNAIVGYLIEWDEPKPEPPAAPVAMASPAPSPGAMPAPAAATAVASIPTTPTPATPAPDEAGPKLAALQAQYDAAYARDIAAFDAGRDTLRTNYQAAIDREIAKAAQAGKLADAVALREERVRAGLGKGLDSDDSALPELLRPLRAGYRTNLAKLDTARTAKLKPLRDAFLRLLEGAQTEFTRAQKLDAALAIKTQRDRLSAEWAAEALPVGEASPSLSTSTTGDAVSSWRRLAQTAVRFSAKIDIKLDGKRMPLLIEADIPNRRFEIVKLDFADWKKNATLTDADLAPLASCRELEEFRMDRAPVTSKGLESLRGSPLLRSVRLLDCPQAGDALAPTLASLPELRTLELNGCGFTKEGMKLLARCQNLRSLTLHGQSTSAGHIAPLDIEELNLGNLADPAALDLSGFKQLKRVTFTGMKDGKARLIEQALKLRNLDYLRFSGCDIGDDDLAKLAGLGGVKTLEFESGTIKGIGLANLRSLRGLTRVRLHNCNVTDTALEMIGSSLTSLQAITISGTGTVQPAAFRQLGKLRALREVGVSDGMGNDGVAAELAALNGVEVLGFNNCPELTDTGLQTLARIKSLKRVMIRACTKLSDAAVEGFKKARPDVNVER